MSTKTKQYAQQCIASAGFAVMTSEFAWQLRPDLWASAQDCAMSFKRSIQPDGTQRLIAKLADGRQVPVVTRSTNELERRLEWVIGVKVVELVNDTQPAVASTQPLPTEFKRLAEEKLAKLKELAAQDLQPHDCTLNKDILAARRELELKAA
ncbi:MAG: hypothetical protein IPJ50_15430 [Betaproteobacteria bacterium]|nr:hypothetical protein [Betaproteobacteria bacterium]